MYSHKRLLLVCIFANIFFGATIISALFYLRAEAAGQKAAAAQSAPYLITYRGLVSDIHGPVNGQKDLGFRVFAQEAGGVPLWAEQHTGIEVRAGEFSVIIGSTGVPSGTLPADLFSAPDRWLEIVVDGSTLEPRQRFTSVPYALNAQNAAYATEALTATYVLSGSSGLPSGALVWLSENSAPAGYARANGLGQDIGAWEALPELPTGVAFVTCEIWTGTEFLCWNNTRYVTSATGARYNPHSNTWVEISVVGAPSARDYASVVWSGQEMIVWGGYDAGGYTNTGARYNPTTDTWAAITITNAPDARAAHVAVWADQEMLIWGGEAISGRLNSGARYNPATNSWSVMSSISAPSPRSQFEGVWTGQEMIIWGGADGTAFIANSGGAYDPTTDTWRPISPVPSEMPPPGNYAHAIWTGSQVVFTPSRYLDYFMPMYLYSPSSDTWETVTLPYPFSGDLSGRPVYLPAEQALVTSAGMYDLIQHKWIAVWDPLCLHLFIVDQRIIGFPDFGGGPLSNLIGYSHTMQLVFPFIKE